jgi:hypothetical protein
MQRGSVTEVVRLLDAYDLGLHGVVSAQAQLSGPVSKIEVTGQFQIDDMHRWDLMPVRGDIWKVPVSGVLDLPGQRLELATKALPQQPLPVALSLRAASFLTKPDWQASAKLTDLPAVNLLAFARHMGTTLPEKIALEGTLNGEVQMGPEGMHGGVESAECRLTLPGNPPLELRDAHAVVEGNVLRLSPSRLAFGEGEEAEIEGRIELATGVRELRISSAGMNLAALRSPTGQILGAADAPVLSSLRQGTWKGVLRYTQLANEPAQWSGEWSLQNATIALDGMSDPLRINSADVVMQNRRASWKRVRGRIAKLAFDADFEYEPSIARPHRIRLFVPRADVAELEALFQPALVRQRGFLARTFGLGDAPVPEWLRSRKVEGTLAIGQLTAAGSRWRTVRGRLAWEGTRVVLLNADARLDDAVATGDLTINLKGWTPVYSVEGRVQDLPFEGGHVELEGKAEAAGQGEALLAALHAEGKFRGRDLELAPDQVFRTASGTFEILPGAGSRWKLSNIEAQQGVDVYTGQGTAAPDGRVVLDLSGPRRQLRLTASLPPISLP